MSTEAASLERFLNGEVEPREFPHRAHVHMAFALLKRCDFTTALTRYEQALRGLTARAGRPEAFNLTVTVAFLALIAERMAQGDYADFAAFAAAHPELLDKAVLRRWYPDGQLETLLARRTFLLPAPAA